jgi:hypothetical protein
LILSDIRESIVEEVRLQPPQPGEGEKFIYPLSATGGVAVPETAAKCCDAVFGVFEIGLHDIIERDDDPAARLSQRMPQRQGATPDVDIVKGGVPGNAPFAQTGQRLTSKGFVNLPDTDIFHRQR